jgi:NTP pyrophosphatase (non-canonical NTP hydrolase)
MEKRNSNSSLINEIKKNEDVKELFEKMETILTKITIEVFSKIKQGKHMERKVSRVS